MTFEGSKLQFYTSALHDIDLYRNYLERFMDERCRLEDRIELWQYFIENPEIGVAIAKSYMLSNEARWENIVDTILVPKLTIIWAGIKGSGKTATLLSVGEAAHRKHGMKVCLYEPLYFRPELLPKYFYDAYDESEIEENSMVGFDEAQIFISSRRSSSTDNVDFTSKFLTIQRHTGNPVIISQQVAQMTDVNAMRLADYLLFKIVGWLQIERESKRKDPILTFLEFLRPLNVNEVLFMDSALTKVILAKAPLPSFWCDELSKPGKRLNDIEAIIFGKKLYLRGGISIKSITNRLQILGKDWTKDEVDEYCKMSLQQMRRMFGERALKKYSAEIKNLREISNREL